MKEKPFFSVVVPCYERPDYLRKCLFSIGKDNQATFQDYEIIVSDDSKSDKCRTVVEDEFPQVKWGKGKQIGPAGNRNAGVNRANGLWVVFLDDDCIAEKNFLQSYYEVIKSDPSLEVLEGTIIPNRSRETWAEGCPINESGGLFWTSNLCVKKSVFLNLKGLDEQFAVAYEDVDFAYRIKQNEIKTAFVPKARVCHPWRSVRKNSPTNWKAKDYESADFIRFLKKHHPKDYEFSLKGYARNLTRMLTRDLITCMFTFKMKGIDVLCFQILVTIKSIIYILKYNR